MSLRTDLEKLAGNVARKAELEKTPLVESIDALKALTGLFSVLQKGKKSGNDDEDEGTGFTFETPLNGVSEEPPNGRSDQVRARRRDS